MKIGIIFEDDDIVVVNKPSGVVVHSAPGHMEENLADYLASSRPGMRQAGSSERPGVVHRLDIETSGVMVFAKTQRAYLRLRKGFESHEGIVKTYLAVLHGAPKPSRGRLETLIGRKSWDGKRMAVVEKGGSPAVSEWCVLKRLGSLALVEFKIATGRMHQIRVHAAHLGHPVVGDALYGDRAKDMRLRRKPRRHLLHAVSLEFPHPVTGCPVSVSAIPPDELVYCIL